MKMKLAGIGLISVFSLLVLAACGTRSAADRQPDMAATVEAQVSATVAASRWSAEEAIAVVKQYLRDEWEAYSSAVLVREASWGAEFEGESGRWRVTATREASPDFPTEWYVYENTGTVEAILE